ncbi:SulP family inorganic anion transporter [Mycolicibacterium porcinum]|uniref:SulP family inorganic anion transporter n=2 Tax=Mycolicibacterium porcinum TaxID=39693 RepID=A0AAW5T0U1_9MYCO|nr:SulP family inorganic anion transporter [Mycolicibacterium porcinum]MCV7388302.1 SulP family inorganic anion transporter [Mycolicibacterium porcinum]ORB40560.1 transporter [Mycolicibacterium porcinum]CDO32351.1 putative sulfate transporter [Mycolicibacterium vulneris]
MGTPTFVRKLGRPKPRDVIAGLVTGLFSIPEGMAYASIGGFNPVTGIYAGVMPGIIGSLFARTVLMVTTLTSAIALTSRSVLKEAGLDPADPANVAALALVVGVVMLLFGLLRFGSIMNFVSNAVMTGFSTGIALQIVAGVLGDATGYKPQSGNTIGKFIDSLAHIGLWHPAAVVVALGTVAVWAVFHFIKPLESFATLLALVVVTAVVAVAHIDVETVGDIASIANALPPVTVPNFAAMPELLVGGVAVALVALAQAAGISAAVPNPDGSRTNMNGDFLAQGAANVAGGLFGALPAGGSLSRTGVATSAGAQTRWAGIFAGLWLAVLVLVAGSAAEIIPMPVIGGLILVIGAELVVGRLPDIKLVLRVAPLSAVAMLVTFAATTQLPLHTAIVIGVITSLVLYCAKAAEAAQLVALTPAPDGGWQQVPVPERCAGNDVTVLHYAGVGLFAEVARIDETWPRAEGTTNAVVVLSLRSLPDVPSSVTIKALRRWAGQLAANNGRLIIAGVNPGTAAVLLRGGLDDLLGADGVVPASDRIFGALDVAVERGRAWVAAQRGEPGDSPQRDSN